MFFYFIIFLHICKGHYIMKIMPGRILIIGCGGQIGTPLTNKLTELYGSRQILLSDIKPVDTPLDFVQLDVTDKNTLFETVKKYDVKEVYLLAALLSATAEKKPAEGWKINMEGLFNVLHLAKDKYIEKIFWPSSIAIFGPTTPKKNTPQHTVVEPVTVYGISKYAGELWCQYYHQKYGVDVRSLRYPGLISYDAPPGGGTTDYAVEIFHYAIKKQRYTCFLKPDTRLPMMYMPDAIHATISLMESSYEKIRNRMSYNIHAFDFTPQEIFNEIKKHIPEFTIDYQPDFRQQIADSWPQSIDDTEAKNDWGWQPKYSFSAMVEDMIKNLQQKILKNV